MSPCSFHLWTKCNLDLMTCQFGGMDDLGMRVHTLCWLSDIRSSSIPWSHSGLSYALIASRYVQGPSSIPNKHVSFSSSSGVRGVQCSSLQDVCALFCCLNCLTCSVVSRTSCMTLSVLDTYGSPFNAAPIAVGALVLDEHCG